jgi:hypothetical protein
MFTKQQKLPVVSIIFDKQYNMASTHIILHLQSQYIFSLLMFVAKNKDSFKTNSYIHSFNTRFNHVSHIPIANLAVFQKGVWYYGTKVYNHLPPTLKQLLHNAFKFKTALKRFLLANAFYTLDEYYSWKQGL